MSAQLGSARWKVGRSKLTFSFCSAVNTEIAESLMVHHCRNCCFHCMTDTPEVQRTMQDLRMVVAAVMPTSVLPAPQGRTMIPDRARL